MTDKQLKFLTNFKEDKIGFSGKTSDSEIKKLVSELKSLNVISEKPNNTTLIITDLISFDKLIELKSLTDFKKWYSEKDKSMVNNSLNNYGDNYGIQSLDGDLKNPKIKNTIAAPINNPATKSLLKNFFSNPWTIGIGLIIIEEIFIGFFRGFLNL